MTIGNQIRLRRCYEGALYRIDTLDGPLLISPITQCDRSAKGLDDLWRLGGSRKPKRTTAAIVTACNPGSRLRAPIFNRVGHQRLAAWVRRRGYEGLPATGLDPAGSWPDEPGLCILGCPGPVAREFAATFGQAAFVWIEKDRGATIRFIEGRTTKRGLEENSVTAGH